MDALWSAARVIVPSRTWCQSRNNLRRSTSNSGMSVDGGFDELLEFLPTFARSPTISSRAAVNAAVNLVS